MSRIYYDLDDNIDANAGTPIGNGWRLLRHDASNDGNRQISILFRPATDERVIHVGPLTLRRVSSLIAKART